MAWTGLSVVQAAPISNSGTGSLNGSGLDLTNATVNLNQVPSGNAVTSVLAEISPNAVSTNGVGIPFAYDILPTINAGDSGLNEFVVTAPAGFSSFLVTAVSVGGAGLTTNCPAPGAGQYCAGISGQIITVTLGTKVTTSLTTIRMDFSADTPGVPGNGDFSSTVDDTSSGAVPPQATTPGNADGDAADSNSITVTTTSSIDPLRSNVTVSPSIVVADGTSVSTITVTLLDTLGNPVSGKTILLSSNRGIVDTITQPLSPTDVNGQATGTIASLLIGEAVITADDTTDGVILADQPSIFFTQGKVIELTKMANKKDGVVGDIVTYRIELKNTTGNPVSQVQLEDRIPENFKYLKGSTLINGAKAGDPAGFRSLIYDIGTIPAWIDLNGNGVTDPDEPGFLTVSYQLIVGSGATPGDYTNIAVARDVCPSCQVSNSDEATVTVTLDPFFDLATIIGKVYEDKNRNGIQDRDEAGISGTMVVLDDGTYALTDEHGRYHFPAIRPGQRMVKINLQSIAIEARATTPESVILTVTPGLLSKANFGIVYVFDEESIGREKEYGILMVENETEKPIEVVGSVETLTVLINGQMTPLPSGIVRMSVEGIEEVIEIQSGELVNPVVFQLAADSPETVKSWNINIVNYLDEVVRVLPGEGPLPDTLEWDGITDDGTLVESGQIYHYGLELEYLDGTRISSPRRIFGIDRTTAVSLNLTGGAFKSGSDTVSEKAKEVLKETAEILRKFPNEKIMIEGHTDSIGANKTNLELSKIRAQAAVDFLVNEENIDKERFIVRWFGETKPIAGNDTEEGRLLNRRVEVRGEIKEVDRAKLHRQYRTQPTVRIDGFPVGVDPKGRFTTEVDSQGKKEFEFEGMSSQGRKLRAIVPIPVFELYAITENRRIAYGDEQEGLRAFEKPGSGLWKPGETALTYKLTGRTDPGNTVRMDGTPLVIKADGGFETDLSLAIGNNSYGFIIQNPDGFTRITNLLINVTDRDKEGNLIVAVEPIPRLSVNLPPEGIRLTNPELTISGQTDSENTIEINGDKVPVGAGGEFTATLDLPKGKSRVAVRVTDPEGYTGTIERNVEVSDTRLFLLAFADGEVGRLKGKGYLEGAGMDKTTEFYNKGRVAYYLKGVVSGKYLITSAFDSGTRSFNKLFKDLDEGENDRLLTNIDPDQMYPVYGDSSTLVYENESQGKFYLAVDGDVFKFLVGNYAIHLNDTELATFQRTLYGSRLMYESAARTPYGDPDTKIVLFGAEVKQAHIRDELAATGGSLYYLSHRDIIEGSEQVTLLVRDKNTGLVLSRIPQEQNKDYSIKYEEGRILFNRLVSTTASDSSLVDSALLSGNPVSIQVDYESELDSFEKTGAGGRVRKQVGDHFALGGTYVKDELNAGRYELQGLDTEVRLGKNNRIIGEYAETSGTDSLTFLSSDGGLSFDEVTPNGVQEGKAWKTAIELDPGEWFGSPDRIRTSGYFKRLESGFLTSGNFLEQGTNKYGVNLDLRLTSKDTLLARYSREEHFGSLAPELQDLNKQQRTALQWRHEAGRWGLKTEYQYEEFLGRTTGRVEKQGLAAVQLRLNPTEKLITRLEHQQTMSGEPNNQSSLGLEYQVFKALSLEAAGTRGTQGQSAQGGAVWSFGKNRAYLTERLTDDSAGRTTSTILGNETKLGKTGKVYSEYQWERAEEGNKNLNLIGARKEWQAAGGLKFQLAGEFTRINLKGPDSDRYALSPGILYGTGDGLKALTRGEIRRETGATDITQYISVNNLELKLNPDFTLLGKFRYSVTSDHDKNEKDAELQERSIGLAYRPVRHDRFNALARLTRLSDEKPFSLELFKPGKSTMDVFSVEWSLQVTRLLEWVEKEAARIKREADDSRGSIKSRSYLSIHRLNLQVSRKIYFGLEYRILRQLMADDQKEGWLTELSWEVVKHLRFGIGYNFTEFSDNEFSDNDFSVQGWFFRGQARF